MATFYNQAVLSYNGNTTTSNITTGELLEVISATKTAVVDEYTENDAVIWDARQEASLTLAYDLLEDALCGLTMGDPLDAVCTVCETALAEIRGVDGRAVDEDIIAGIFARFCVGK